MKQNDLVKVIGDHWAEGLTGLFVEESFPKSKIRIEENGELKIIEVPTENLIKVGKK
jgi:hypothetical protein